MSLPKKPRKCRHCKQMFQPVRCGQNTCCYECSVAVADIAAERSKNRREQAERVAEVANRKILKLKLKTRSEWMKEAQIAFNAYIRARDASKPCICCGQPLASENIGGSFDCGHYRSVGSAPHLRFDERNAHGQRKQCNRYGAGRAVDYRIGLVNRIGQCAVDALESDNEPRKWTIEELKSIKAEYKQKLKELQRGN